MACNMQITYSVQLCDNAVSNGWLKTTFNARNEFNCSDDNNFNIYGYGKLVYQDTCLSDDFSTYSCYKKYFILTNDITFN